MKLSYRGSGAVEVQGKKRECHLYLNEEDGGILLEIIVMEAHPSTLELPDHIIDLKVELSNGAKFVLFDVYCSKGVSSNVSSRMSTFSFSAKYYVSGFSDLERFQNKFKSVFFEISGVMRWGGKSAYSIGDNYGVHNEIDDGTLIYKDDSVNIKYHVRGTMLPVHEFELFKDRIELVQKTLIEIEVLKETSLDSFFSLFEKTKRLIELTLVEEIVVHKIQGLSNLEFDMYDSEHKIPRTLEIISPIIRKDRFKGNYYGRYILNTFLLNDLIKNNNFKNYFDSYHKLKPVIELYMELLYMNGISSVRLFLNVVQALETYHSRFKAGTMSEFKDRVKTLTDGRTDGMENFLLAKSKSFITLESRLADLVLAEYQGFFITGDISMWEFPSIIANTRNYYIHYDESIKDRGRVLTEDELTIYNNCLLIILDYYIYSELGFSDHHKLKEKLIQRWGDIRTTLGIKKAFEDKYGKYN
ncbi:HEPN domain-containing protein [Streptococcus suis]|uniref:HEPN domain-containing protein n=1 Tax=Streptococcus suis TaxID=1307 RepID=UPI003F899CE8